MIAYWASMWTRYLLKGMLHMNVLPERGISLNVVLGLSACFLLLQREQEKKRSLGPGIEMLAFDLHDMLNAAITHFQCSCN